MGSAWSHNGDASCADEVARIDESPASSSLSSSSLSESAAHVASERLARHLARTVRTLPRARSIGIAGPISAGKTTLGRALQIACERAGIPCHFAPEVVQEGALQLYIGGQRLPEWFTSAVDGAADSAALLRYNRAFYDVDAYVPTARVVDRIARTTNVHATSFQILMLASCQHRVREAALFLRLQPRGLAIVDRTAWDNTVFEEANRCLYRAISDDDHRFYESVRGVAPAFGVDELVYLDVAPDVTLERIRTRGSSAETAYQRTYMVYLVDIWFHRIVQNYTETPHYSLFDDTLVACGDDDDDSRRPFPIHIVQWNDFTTASIEALMERVANRTSVPLPRVRFVAAASDARDCNEDGDNNGDTVDDDDGWTGWTTMHWTRDYAAASASDEQRAQFRRRAMALLARGARIRFQY